MYHTTFTIGITSCIISLVMVWILTKANPLVVIYNFSLSLFKNKLIIIHFIMLFFILFLNKMELKFEQEHIRIPDLSKWFYEIEGDTVAYIQQTFENIYLTHILTFFYIIIFMSMMISSILIYFNQKEYHLFYASFYAVMINYFIAIPFYLFFPINEIWVTQEAVDFLIPEVYQDFESEYRKLSGLNNCFPSLHTSLSLTMALLSYKSFNKLMKITYFSFAIIIIFSIFYLGIHWITDMVGGILLAFVATYFGLKIEKMNKLKINK